MGLRLDGRNPLSYMGVRPVQAPSITVKDHRPTTRDIFNFTIGDFWVVPLRSTSPSSELWQLMGNAQNVATWVNIAASTGELDVRKLEGNSGGEVLPDVGNLINIVGDGDVTVVGTPLTNTLTISVTEEASGIRYAQVVMSSAQIKNSLSGPLEIVAAPGANKFIIPIYISLYYEYGGTSVFTGSGSNINILYGDNSNLYVPGIVNASSASIPQSIFLINANYFTIGAAALGTYTIADITNLPLSFQQQLPSTPFTGNAENNNQILVTVAYMIGG